MISNEEASSHVMRSIIAVLIAIVLCALSVWTAVRSELILEILNQPAKPASGAYEFRQAHVSILLIIATAVIYLLNIYMVRKLVLGGTFKAVLLFVLWTAVPVVSVIAALLAQQAAITP